MVSGRSGLLTGARKEVRHHGHIVISRWQRVLNLRTGNTDWRIWTEGYGRTLDALERGNKEETIRRYRCTARRSDAGPPLQAPSN